MKTKLPKFLLKTMTCSQFADWLEKPAEGKERKSAEKMRQRFANWNGATDLLRKCGDRSALQHLAHMKTARHLSFIPEISMMVGGGRPECGSLPPFTESLRKMAEDNGMPTLHRWGKGAFILKRKEP
jgi:hypothetical protein